MAAILLNILQHSTKEVISSLNRVVNATTYSYDGNICVVHNLFLIFNAPKQRHIQEIVFKSVYIHYVEKEEAIRVGVDGLHFVEVEVQDTIVIDSAGLHISFVCTKSMLVHALITPTIILDSKEAYSLAYYDVIEYGRNVVSIVTALLTHDNKLYWYTIDFMLNFVIEDRIHKEWLCRKQRREWDRISAKATIDSILKGNIGEKWIAYRSCIDTSVSIVIHKLPNNIYRVVVRKKHTHLFLPTELRELYIALRKTGHIFVSQLVSIQHVLYRNAILSITKEYITAFMYRSTSIAIVPANIIDDRITITHGHVIEEDLVYVLGYRQYLIDRLDVPRKYTVVALKNYLKLLYSYRVKRLV